MQKNKNIFLALLLTLLVVGACNEEYKMGEFDADSSLMPGARTDGPLDPSAIVASYDDYCDKVVLSWMPTARTTAYDVYRNGELLAQDIVDTSYVDSDALTSDTEYAVYSKNVNGKSEGSKSAIGRMSAIPLVPENFTATDGEFEAKVGLSWDAADFAKHYVVKRAGVVLSDNVTGTSFFDDVNAPEEETEYSVIAVGVCGESAEAKTTGYCDPLVAFRIPFQEDFESASVGTPLTDLGFATNFGWKATHTGEAVVKVRVDGSDRYGSLKQTGDGLGAALTFPTVELVVGKRYQISFDVKSGAVVSLFMRNTDDNKYLEYLIPSDEHTGKNNNNQGRGIQNIGGTGEWVTFTQDFPYTTSKAPIDQTGDGTNATGKKPNNIHDTGRTDQSTWTASTITEAQKSPYIEVSIYNAAALDGWGIDNIKIEMLK
ncbi:MAG: hypothetical protein J7L95_08230 [Prolixibacteraceae bacterium]|nr:hypothetical protein [Prolixibacteraceae bacterium]